MLSAIADMIIKASDNINRGAENASKAGEGNNGVDYSNVDTGGETGASGGSNGGYTPTEQDTSGADSAASAAKGMTSNIKNIVGNAMQKDEDESKEDAASSALSMPTTSDERLKRIFGDNPDAIEAFAKLDSIKFTYNDKAKEIHPNGENGVDNDQHYGIKAQDLEKNPYTTAVVSNDPEGYKQIDPAELTSVNTAVIAEICKRLLIIEKVLGIKVV